ncbi:MAG: site-2 protease family protein [Labilithrix sp.]|nr:site-2 protease family protein [Labilithrix sp.]
MAHILLAIFGISLLMIVHEAGHYVMARATGMRVTTFSIGFGPALVRYRRRGSPTTFQLCLVPFLAYVRVAGSNPLEENDPKDSCLYENKSIGARALMLIGGPVANYVFASIVVFGLALGGWREEVPTTPMILAGVEAGSPADGAGLRVGDVIVEVEGKTVQDVGEMSAITSQRAGTPTRFTVEREGKPLPLTVIPRESGGRGVIGVTAKVETRTRRLPVSEAAALAVELPWTLTAQNLEGMAGLVKHRSTEGLTGPVGMVKQVATQAERGPFAYLSILVMISVALGFFNLLPFPFLDGGRLLFLGYELVTARRPNQNVEAIVHAAGMLLLLGMAALVTWRDILG